MPPPRSRPRILIADPYEREYDNLLQHILDELGFDAETTSTIKHAREKLSSGHFDLLVCRNAMPDGSAVQFVPQVWREFRLPSIITTGTMSEEAMAARIPPEVPCLVRTMPFKIDRLIAAIDALMAPCRDCRGAGTIPLLVRRVTCTTCAGTGRAIWAQRNRPIPAAGGAIPAHSS